MKKQALASNPLLWQIQTFLGERILWILGVFFVLLLWWYVQEGTPSNDSNSKTGTLVPLKKPFSGEGTSEEEPEEEPEEEEEPELIEERKQLRALQAKSTFQVYTKNFGTEQELLEELLGRYGVTLETIRDFPEDALEDLTEEERELLAKYQNQEVTLNSLRQQIELYENIFKTRFKEIRKYRKEFIARVKSNPVEIECALLERLSDPFLSEPFYKEILFLLERIGGPKHTFDTLVFLFENEKTPSKQFCLFEAMLTLDSTKAITFLFKTFEGPIEIDISRAKGSIYQVLSPGMEEFLASFLDSKIPKISQVAKELLLQMNSPEAIKFLRKHEKDHLKKQDTKSLKAELLKKIQKEDLNQLEHQEATFKLCLLPPESFEEIEALFLKETDVEKRIHWFSPMINLNKKKALPLLINSLESKNEMERMASREIVKKIVGPGLESYLEPLLKKSSELSDLPEFARSILLQIDSPMARKMLKSIKTSK